MSLSPFEDLYEIENLLKTKPNCKKNKLYERFERDLYNLVSKYEYLYHKHIIKNKPVRLLNSEKEKQIAIVQEAIKRFFPYILAHNVALMSQVE